MRTRPFPLALAALTLSVFALLPARAATRDVRIDGFAFSPPELTVDVGDQVRWTNADPATHTVTADDGSGEQFDSGNLGPDDTFTHTFATPGTFAYHCDIHGSMRGSITVRAQATTTTAPPATTRPATTTTSRPPVTTTSTSVTSTTVPSSTSSTSSSTSSTTSTSTTLPGLTVPTTSPTGPDDGDDGGTSPLVVGLIAALVGAVAAAAWWVTRLWQAGRL
jgi:plastocyanin